MASIAWETDGHGFEVCGVDAEEALKLFRALGGHWAGLTPMGVMDSPRSPLGGVPSSVAFDRRVEIGGDPPPSNVAKETAVEAERRRCETIVKSGLDAPTCAEAIRNGKSFSARAPDRDTVRIVTPEELLKIAVQSGMPPDKAEELRGHMSREGRGTVRLQGQEFMVSATPADTKPGEGGRPFISPDAFKFGVRAGGTAGRS